MLTIHVFITFGWAAKPGLSVKNSLGFSAVSIHGSPCSLLHSHRHKSSASIGHCPFMPLVKEMEFTNCFPDILQWDRQLQGNGCVDGYQAFKEYHLECDLYLRDTIINVYQVYWSFCLSFSLLSLPKCVIHGEQFCGNESSVLELPWAWLLHRTLRAVPMWLATYQDCFVSPKAFDGTTENFTSKQCISLYRNLANKRRLFWISVCSSSLLASCLQQLQCPISTPMLVGLETDWDFRVFL